MSPTICRSNRRSLLRALAGAGLLGGAGISGLIGRVLAAGNSPALQGIRRMSGKVEVNGSSAGQGQRILPGDTVTTGADGEVVYVIGENAFLQRARSSVSFGDSATAGVLRIISGKLLSVFGKGPQKIVASTATIGIRGTGCYIESAPDLVYFCLCYGEADLVPTAAPAEQELIKTTHHDRPLYIHNDMKMPTMMVPAGVINHTDLELTLLESLVGRLPPFAGKRPYLSG